MSQRHSITFAPCIKSRHFCISFKLSTNYLWPSLHSSQIVWFNNLMFYCFVLNILLHYNDLTLALNNLYIFTPNQSSCPSECPSPFSAKNYFFLFPILIKSSQCTLPSLIFVPLHHPSGTNRALCEAMVHVLQCIHFILFSPLSNSEEPKILGDFMYLD